MCMPRRVSSSKKKEMSSFFFERRGWMGMGMVAPPNFVFEFA